MTLELDVPGQLGRAAGVRVFGTTRRGGVSMDAYASLNLALHVLDLEKNVRANRELLAQELGGCKPFFVNQVHGVTIFEVDGMAVDAPDEPRADILAVRCPGIAIGVLGADCPLLAIYSAKPSALCLLHAGWRGLSQSIIAQALRWMTQQAGASAASLLAYVGPAIGVDHYEVAQEIADAVSAGVGQKGDLVRGEGGKLLLDLCLACRLSLLQGGVLPENIEMAQACTFSQPERYFSYRRDGARTGRQALIGMLNG